MANLAIRPRVNGETESEYKNYVRMQTGEAERAKLSAQGIDTSGQYWDGSKFKAADAGPMKFIAEHPWVGAAIPLGVAGAFALPGMLAGGSGVIPGTGIPTASGGVGVGAAPAAAATSGATAGGAKVGGGFLSKIFGGKGLDPTAMLLTGLSMFGGDDSGQQRQSFGGKGTAGLDTNPTQSLQHVLNSIFRLGQGLQERGPTRLRSSVVQPSIAPVQLPGIPFQIGGGLGRDPALDDPSLLQSDPGRQFNQYDPMQSLAKTQQPNGQHATTKRREPQ